MDLVTFRTKPSNYNLFDFDIGSVMDPSQDCKNITEKELLRQEEIVETVDKYFDSENEAQNFNDTREINFELQNISFNVTENMTENKEPNLRLPNIDFTKENTQHHTYLENSSSETTSNKKVKILSSIRFSSENIPFNGSENFLFSELKPIDKTADISKPNFTNK